MTVEKRIKCASAERRRRYRDVLDRIARNNVTGHSDETVLAILNADRGPWTSYASVDEMFATMGIATS
ncbi:hypothetical protein G5S35_01125 [Paraburkholderia tropica]|uniref:hypothetical protein n=1 Tax=Paraburkholderia tropica TaxID=92647 RepID=UPI001603A9B7|nr:hypothetical protein [Paraburkholderia tropica]QNB10300.1 hypothetical protein G5S35_01125 [Paraburkholderia tropica]